MRDCDFTVICQQPPHRHCQGTNDRRTSTRCCYTHLFSYVFYTYTHTHTLYTVDVYCVQITAYVWYRVWVCRGVGVGQCKPYATHAFRFSPFTTRLQPTHMYTIHKCQKLHSHNFREKHMHTCMLLLYSMQACTQRRAVACKACGRSNHDAVQCTPTLTMNTWNMQALFCP